MLKNLRTRLVIVFIGLSVIPLVVVSLVLNRLSFNSLEEQAVTLQTEIADQTAVKISNYFVERQTELLLAIATQEFGTMTAYQQKEFLQEMLSYQPSLQELSLLDKQGKETSRVSRTSIIPETQYADYAQSDIFNVPASTGKIYYQPVQFDKVILEPLMMMAAPIPNPRTGQVDHVLVAQLRFKPIWSLIADLKLETGEEVYVTNAQGNLVAYRNPSVVLRETSFMPPAANGHFNGLFGNDVILASSRIQLGDQALVVVAERPFELATALAAQISTVSLIAITVVPVLAIVLAFLFIDQIVKPLRKLAQVAAAIQGGDLSQRAAIMTSDEIGKLANAFNRMTDQLQTLIGSLEERVAARTRDLATTIEVGKLATSIYSQQELLPKLVDFIREQFGLYYTQIYLLDEAGRYALLRAGTGDAGQQLLARGHRLDLAETSLVARAVQSGETVLVSDTTTSNIHKANELLPNTRSEVTIPLKVGGTTLGVLDMQADAANTFNKDNVPVFEAMASQIASVLRGNAAYAEAQTAIQSAEAVNRRLTTETWQSYLGKLENGQVLGYQYDLEAPQPLADGSPDGFDGSGAPIVQPVMLRGQKIGRIVVKEEQERAWKPEELLLMEDVAQHVAQALEQYRAFDEIKRAETEQALLLTELQNSTHLIRTVIDSTPDLIFAKDSNYRYILVNGGYAGALGLDPEAMIGQNDLELGFPEELVFGNPEKGIRGFRADDELVLKTGQTIHNPNDPVALGDGSIHIFDTQKVPLRDADGQVFAVLGFSRDINELKQQEEEIRQAREEAEILYRVSAAINEARDEQGLVEAVCTYSMQHDITNIALTICENYDYDTASSFTLVGEVRFDGGPSYVGMSMPAAAFPIFQLLDRYHINVCEDVATDPLFDEQSRQAIMGFGIRSYVFAPLTTNDRWMGNLGIYSDKPQTYTEREIRMLSGIRDQLIAAFERMRLTRQAERNAAELATVAKVSTATTTILNMDDLLQAVSDLTKESFNLYHAHVYLMDETGENLVLAAGAGEVGRAMKAAGRTIAMNRQNSLVARVAREKRGIIVSDITQEPDFLPNPLLPATRSEMPVPMIVGGQTIGVLDVQADTPNRFTETDLTIMSTLADQVAIAVQNARAFKVQMEAAERLSEADRMKSQFLANMSHELRTPLNSIIGYAEVLLDGIDGELGDEAVEDVEAIHGGGKHLLSMINDILDLAKIDAGQMYMDRHETDLTKIIDEVIHTCQILVKDKGIGLEFERPAEFPTIYGDPVRLRQIIYNLVNNAIKFTEKGGVTIGLELHDNQEACVIVKDTGIGMSQKDLGVIFERFRQVDGSATRRAGGTGLGLAITRQLVQMHDGEIHVASEPGVGSTFWFTLPVFEGQTA